MSAKRAHESTGSGASEDDAWNASLPAVVFYKSRNKYALRSQHKVEKGKSTGKEKFSYGYPSEEAAKEELKLFRFAIHRDGAKYWDNFNMPGPRNARYTNEYRTFNQPTHSIFDDNLNAAQAGQFKKIRKVDPAQS